MLLCLCLLLWMSSEEMSFHSGSFSWQETHNPLDANIKEASKPAPLESYSSQAGRRTDPIPQKQTSS